MRGERIRKERKGDGRWGGGGGEQGEGVGREGVKNEPKKRVSPEKRRRGAEESLGVSM